MLTEEYCMRISTKAECTGYNASFEGDISLDANSHIWQIDVSIDSAIDDVHLFDHAFRWVLDAIFSEGRYIEPGWMYSTARIIGASP